MSASGSFTSNDATIRVTDKSTQIVKLQAAIDYHIQECNLATGALRRLDEKYAKFEKFLVEINAEIIQAENESNAAEARLLTARVDLEKLMSGE